MTAPQTPTCAPEAPSNLTVVAATTTVGATARYHEREGWNLLRSLGAAKRFVRSFVRHAAEGEAGLTELAAIVELRNELNVAIDAIATTLLADDASCREVGVALGITQQAVAKRYPGVSARQPGGQPAHLR